MINRRHCTFRPGDAVEEIDGNGKLMIVVEVLNDWSLERPLIDCTWQDSETKAKRVRTFLLSQIKHFDWDTVMKNSVTPDIRQIVKL